MTEPKLSKSYAFPSDFIRSGDSRVLDLGCGDGELGAILRTERSALEVWGLEKRQQMAELARTKLDRVVVADPDRQGALPLPSQHFDCVLLSNGLGGLADPVGVLKKIKPLLRPNGRMVLRNANGAHASALARLFSGELPQGSSWTPLSVRRALFEAGYRVIEEVLRREGGAKNVTALGTALESASLPVADLNELLEVAEQIAVAEPLQPVVDIKTVGQLGPHSIEGASVVVLAYNSMKTLEPCLDSVLKTLNPEDELILVDNASTDGTIDYLKKYADLPQVQVVLNDKNLGFSGGCNAGLIESKGKYLCLLNPDTVVFPGWLERMKAVLDDPSVGMVGPVSDYVTGYQFIGNYFSSDELRPATIQSIAGAVHQKHRGMSIDSKLIIGFCAMTTRETLDLAGLLDENLFLGSDDLELSWRLRTHGLRLVVALDVFVHHEGGASFASLQSENKKRLLYESTEALIRKVTNAYGWRPSDTDLWGFEITHK